MLSETAHAKVNLALHIRSRRPDGYHELESLFVFCADGDVLTAEPRDDGLLTLDIKGAFAAELNGGEDNLVLRAAHSFRHAANVTAGAALILDKRLPIASGIGGGSADAAAALRLLMRLWAIEPSDVDLHGIALELGADVPACLGSTTMFGTGVGEQLSPVDSGESDHAILLVNPLLPCPTGPVFRAWDGVDRGALVPEDWRAGRNDLQPPALTLVPEIGAVLNALERLPGINCARMSGSGATCFALFDDEVSRDAAQTMLTRIHPGWWTLASHIV